MRKSLLNKNSPYDVSITEIGAQGDGIAVHENRKFYVSYAAPGDQLSVRAYSRRGDGFAAEIVKILAASPDRNEPECRHFGRCGGCALQHLRLAAISTHKRNMLVKALSHRGLHDAPTAETISIAAGTRRRLRLSISRQGKPKLGLKTRRGHEVIDIQECPIAAPVLVDILPAVRALSSTMTALGKRADLSITATDNGLDLLFSPAKPAELRLKDREVLADFAVAHEIARISWDGPAGIEPVIVREPPRLTFGPATINPPAGAFLQPSQDGEHAIAGRVTTALKDCTACADLYAGCGTIAFPLSDSAKVHAFEISTEMVAAIRHADGAQITANERDLATEPLTAKELSRFDGVVFDPPRAGAKTQAMELALSSVEKIAAVSCNPATLARDLRILVDGGYRIKKITPIDQFAWSPHLEAVAELTRI